MYHRQFKNGVFSAVLIWLLNMLCLYLAGRFSDNDLLYWGTGIVPAAAVVFITYRQDHGLKDLGFYPDHLKHDGTAMFCMLIIELLIGVYWIRMPWKHAVRSWLYYIFWIVLQEELVYRGGIQSHLFSPRLNRKVSYLIGAVMFSASHIPYQMQIRSWDTLFTIQLFNTFLVHLVYGWITEKRGNLCVPWAIHVASDFLEIM